MDLIDKNMSINQIAKSLKKSANTITYWLKKFELKTNHLSFKDRLPIVYGITRCCPKCHIDKPTDEFYNRRGEEGSSVYCKLCTRKQNLDRQRNLKQLAIEYKGGCCQKCGYNKYNGALEFHHLNPIEKDFNIANLKSYAFNSVVKNELDKCVLLCSNCHKETHSGL